MLAGIMNVIEIDSSDSDEDFEFDFDDPVNDIDHFQDSHNGQQFVHNGPQNSLMFYDDEWPQNGLAPSSSLSSMNDGARLTNGEVINDASQMHHGNGRVLPLTSANGKHVESNKQKALVSSMGRSEPHSSPYNGMFRDSASPVPPSLASGKIARSTHLNAASGMRELPPSFRSSDENRGKGEFVPKSNPGVAMADNGNSKGEFNPKSNRAVTMAINGNHDDIHVIGSSSSTRVPPPTLSSRSPANLEMDNIEDRHMDSGERIIYQEALQHLGQQKAEEDLPEGVLTVPLLKHQKMALAWMVQKENSSLCAGGILADDQGLGKTVSTIALVLKQRDQQSKFTSVDSSNAKPEALNLDEDDDGVTVLKETNNVPKIEPKEEPMATISSAASIKEELIASTSSSASSKKKEPMAGRSSSSASTRPAAGTLVVCPASILKQWANELKDKVSGNHNLSVLVYYGGARTRSPSELAKYDVVVTTYTLVSNEVPKQSLTAEDDAEQRDKYGSSSEFPHNNKRKAASNAQSKSKKKKKRPKDLDIDLDSGPLARVRWFRVVLDEAQTIKNHRTQVARACSGLRAKRRWCLSGTPIQNTIDDLYSYFRFLKYDPLSSYSSFCSMIKHPISRNASIGYKKLQAVLRLVLLRRTKETIIDGEPIINLPPKTIVLKQVEFTPKERTFYLTLEESSRQQFKAYAAAGTVKQNYANILLLLLRLRQACDHPLLVKGHQSNFIGKDSLEMARQLPKQVVVNLLAKLVAGSAICAVCSDPPEDAVVAMCGHVFCYQCIYERLTSDENVCPATGCRNMLGTDSVFSQGTLKISISDKKLDSNGASSSSSSDEESSITQTTYVSSKIQAAVDILNSIINTNALTENCNSSQEAPVKAIVFSQWTSMLDLLELSLNSNLIQYRRLDGTMSLVARDRAVKDFNTDPEVRVMIMSLKAGNLGLNMIAACHVILLDLWWNPYAEDQAVDRAHRIGQTRPVTVSRLTIQDTVEDRILALQEEKRTMVNSAFGEDKSSGRATRLTMEDLKYLFRI